MKPLNKHIILIGFKHVGKTSIGKHLAQKINSHFIDLDVQIELLHEENTGKKLSCRQIMEKCGEIYFRDLETEALRKIVSTQPAVISLGGGTVSIPENQTLINNHIVIHITAPRGIVFERIMMSGRPAFFDLNEDLLDSFNRLYDEREHLHKKLNTITILNNSSIDIAVSTIVEKLS